jgi:hypothetical protein
MESQSKIKLDKLNDELAIIDSKYHESIRIAKQHNLKVDYYRCQRNDIRTQINKLQYIVMTEDMLGLLHEIKGSETLQKIEKLAICKGIDKTNNNSNIWHELKKVVLTVLKFKEQYPGWTLNTVRCFGTHDDLKKLYKYGFKSQYGHYMSYGDIEEVDEEFYEEDN